MELLNRRALFQSSLEKKMAETGEYAVYFRPPTGFRIEKYPCVVYDYSSSKFAYADNSFYIPYMKYEVTLLTRNPDDPGIEKLLEMPCSALFNSRTAAGINEFKFIIYY